MIARDLAGRSVFVGTGVGHLHAPAYRPPGAPECAHDGCIRAPYRDGLCKRHADDAWYREVNRRG